MSSSVGSLSPEAAPAAAEFSLLSTPVTPTRTTILDADPTAVPTAQILDIAVLETFKEGRSVYRAPAAG